MDDREQRVQMVERQIAARGVRDPRVLEALRDVPRHLFVPEDQKPHAYEDRALPIASGQTISQPYIVAIMTELLAPDPDHDVLEIGTGSGYQTAILSRLAKHVVTIERHPQLALTAEQVFSALGLMNVDIRVGDGTEGLPAEAPFDRILVTAGPTYEDIDPVRYVGNRSSGRMGVALAEAARRRGAAVTLVLGPGSVAAPDGIEVVRVRSAAEMHAAVMQALPGQDVVAMAAAVADYTPAAPVAQKITKSDGPLTLTLTRTKDILADLGASRDGAAHPVLVGFAAETADAVARGRRKLDAKRVDLVVANDVTQPGAGFEHDTNAVTIITRDRDVAVPLQSKAAVADRILDLVVPLLGARA